MELRIFKPDDSREHYTTKLSHNRNDWFPEEATVDIFADRQSADPIHTGIVKQVRKLFKSSTRGRYRYRPEDNYFTNTKQIWEVTLKIKDCPIIISKKKTRYYINGQTCSFDTLCHALARVIYKSCFESDPAALMKTLFSTLSLPENVKNVIENRVPYHFYDLLSDNLDDALKPIKVRLNVQQIENNLFAIEIADGVWGTISTSDLDKFCNYYLNGKRRGKWVDVPPAILYERLLGKKPRPSDLDVMLAFLKQNRTRDLVEKRAMQLIDDLLSQYPDRLKGSWHDMKLETLYVKGKHYDWKLTNNGYKTNIQMVSTYVWQPRYSKSEYEKHIEKWGLAVAELEKEGLTSQAPPMPTNPCVWQGPICIDNMAPDSPLGDQFAARALALLNDSFTITIVSTIKRYLIGKPNENRVDLDEMH